MKIVCCSNMPLVEEAFSTLGQVVIKDGRQMTAEDVRDADLMAVRSTTKVDASLLNGSSVKFVGTATIGTDHMDKAYLDSRGIRWTHSPGCNANSVSEYVTAGLLVLGKKHGITLEGKTIGVIGVGNVGSRVAKKAEVLGMNVLLNDPPRQRAKEAGRVTTDDVFLPLEDVLAEADIITMHVPFTEDGPDATVGMASSAFFSKAKDKLIFINAARGGAVDTDALLNAIDTGRIAHTIIDTWEGEPGIRPDALAAAEIATPHIAGHSYEGKVMGTVMVYRAACDFLGVEPSWNYQALLPEPLVPNVSLSCANRPDEDMLHEAVSSVYDIMQDDRQLRAVEGAMAKHFDSLRKNYRIRREFRYTKVSADGASPSLLKKLADLGFDQA